MSIGDLRSFLYSGGKQELTPSEQIELVNKAREGDAVAIETLLKGYGRLTIAICNRFYKGAAWATRLDENDILQVAMIGFLKAVDKYDAEKAQFSTYLELKIKGEIDTCYKRLRGWPELHKGMIDDDFMAIHAVAHLGGLEALRTPDQWLWSVGNKDLAHKLIEKLPLREQEFIRQYYGIDTNPKTIVEVSNLMGISRSTAKLIRTRALQRMKVYSGMLGIEKDFLSKAGNF